MKIRFIRAAKEHAKLLYEWRNDPITRANSHTSEELKWEDHLTWFTNALQNPNREIYFVSNTSQEPESLVAMIRRDRDNGNTDKWILSWMVSPAARGQGLGKILLNQFVASHPAHYLADIKSENEPSIKMAKNAGFKMLENYPDYQRWHFKPL